MGAFKSLTRILAFVGKEIVETTRRPGAIASLILGPFIIMAIFGAGYSGIRRPLQTIVVVPDNSGLPTSIEEYKSLSGPWFTIAAVTGDQAAAEALLATRQVDLVVVAPADLRERFRGNEQSVIQVKYNTVDPVLASYAGFLSLRLSDEVNREIIKRAAAEGEQYAIGAGANEAAIVDPAVIAAPTRTETSNLAPSEPQVIPFFGPAVLALILQHMAVTLIALSLTRERLSGVKEIFRVAPVHTIEILIGKLVAFGILNAIVAGATVALLVGFLKVPILGDPALLVGVIALLILASLGVGLVISLISDSERQAVQLSLLLLLASVFFSGFVLAVDEFAPALQTAAHALPVTNGIRLTQDLMLRGATDAPWLIGILAAISGVLLLISWILLRRDMSRA